MKLKITIDIFSGLENPSFVLGDKEARVFLERVQIQSEVKKTQGRQEPSNLGYRGIIVQQFEEPVKEYPEFMKIFEDIAFAKDVNFRIQNKDAEGFVIKNLDMVKNIQLKSGFDKFILDEFRKTKNLIEKHELEEFKPLPWPPFVKAGPCFCAPRYEPDWWNDSGQIQYNNNCYNYAANYRTDTYAQPGKATGKLRSVPISSCTDSPGYISPKTGAISDCLIDTPAANNKCPRPGHLVALVVAPPPAFGGWGDFHWYRKGNNGKWTHKPGGGKATNVDYSNNIITDPRTADRGSYTLFCTFMKVLHGHIKII